MSAPKPPARNPCGSCPYRRDVPSGIWAAEEYLKLPEYDKPTGEQPVRVFMCHQQDGCLCAGWVGCHDMDNNLAVRINGLDVRNYKTEVPLFSSGAEAAAHGLAGIERPDPKARKAINKLLKRKENK